MKPKINPVGVTLGASILFWANLCAVLLLLIIAICSCARTDVPEKVNSLCVSAYQKGNQGDFAGAIADTTRAIRLDPKSVKALTLRGMAKGKLSDFRAAVADYDEAIKLNPKYEDLYFYRGTAKVQTGDVKGAIADYSIAAEIKPDDAEIYYARGNADEQLNNFRDAISDFSKAIQHNAKYAWAYEDRGWVRVMAGRDLVDGAADCDRAVEIDPSNATLLLDCGEVKRVAKYYSGAMEDFNKAVSIDQHDARAYRGLGLVQDDLFHLELALTNFERSLTLDAAQYEIVIRVYLIRMQLGNGEEVSNEVSETIDTKDYKAEKEASLTVNGVLPFSWALSAEYIANMVPESEYFQSASNAVFMANRGELPRTEEKRKGQLCMAYYFAGMRHLIIGDRSGAIRCFRQCIDTGPVNYGENGYDEYGSAEAELEALERHSGLGSRRISE